MVRILGILVGVALFSSNARSADYGAIAYSEATGDYGFSFDYRSANQATARAIGECKKHGNAPDCRLIQGVASSTGAAELCTALVVLPLHGKDTAGQPKTFRWLSFETAPTQRDAETKAMETCQATVQKIAKGETASTSCELVVGVCSKTGNTPRRGQ